MFTVLFALPRISMAGTFLILKNFLTQLIAGWMSEPINELICGILPQVTHCLNEPVNYYYLNILWISHLFIKVIISIFWKWLPVPIASIETGIKQ